MAINSDSEHLKKLLIAAGLDSHVGCPQATGPQHCEREANRMGQISPPASHSPECAKAQPISPWSHPIHPPPPENFSRRQNAERARGLGTRRPRDSNPQPEIFPFVARGAC